MRWPWSPQSGCVGHGRRVPLALGKHHGVHPVSGLSSRKPLILLMQSHAPSFWGSWPQEALVVDRQDYECSRSCGSWLGRIFLSVCATSPTCMSGAQSAGLGAPLGTLVSSLTCSLLEADLEIMSLLKQGHVLLC